MPAESLTERTRKLELSSATQVVRLDNLREELRRQEATQAELIKDGQQTAQLLSVIDYRLGVIEGKSKDNSSRRWDLQKLIIGAILGCLLTLGAGFAARWLDHYGLENSNRLHRTPEKTIPQK